MTPAGARRWTAAVFLLALIARLGAIFALKRWDDATPGAGRQLANSLLEFGAFYYRDWAHFGPSSIVPPPYPILLAGLFALFGPESPTAYFSALALNAIFGALCAVATIALVRRMIGRDGPAVLAGALVAIWPPQIMASIYAQPMALTALVLVTACLLWRRMMQTSDLLSCIGFAIAAAFAALLEPAMLIGLVVAAVATICVRCWPMDVRIRNLAVLLAVITLFLWPWVARNRAVHGRWLMTTTLWQSIWAGANENATGSDRLPLTPERRISAGSLVAGDDSTSDAVRPPMMQTDLLPPVARYALREKSEADREAQFSAWAGAYMEQHRLRWLMQLPMRIAKVWFIDWDHPLSRNLLALAPRAALALAALGGVVIILQHRAGAGGPMVVIVSMLIAAACTTASAKQTIVIEPMQIALAVGGLSLIRRRSNESVDVDQNLTNVAR